MAPVVALLLGLQHAGVVGPSVPGECGGSDEDRLLAWASATPGFVSRVRIAAAGSHGRGLVLAEDVAEGEMALYVPASLRLALDTSSMPARQRSVIKRRGSEDPAGVGLALAILHERQRGNASGFAHWIRTLPTQPPPNMYFMPARELRELRAASDSDQECKRTVSIQLRCPSEVAGALSAISWDGWWCAIQPCIPHHPAFMFRVSPA